jgi:hypothetical protein
VLKSMKTHDVEEAMVVAAVTAVETDVAVAAMAAGIDVVAGAMVAAAATTDAGTRIH